MTTTVDLVRKPASGSNTGEMTDQAQTIAGVKTFSSGLQLPTSGGTPANLNYYEEYSVAVTSAASGAFASGGAISSTIKIIQVGKLVTLTISGGTGTASAAGQSVNWAAGTIPARFCGFTATGGAFMSAAQIRDNNTRQAAAGAFYVSTDGSMNLYKDLTLTASYTNATIIGFASGVSLSWTLN